MSESKTPEMTDSLGEELVEEVEEIMEKLVDSFNPLRNRLNWLLLALPVAVYAEHSGQMALAFAASMVSIMPLAFLMGKATEEIALRTGEAVGGLLNATFGNAVEMIIAMFALYAASKASKNPEIVDTMVTVTQASLIGSILGNLLLVLGLSMIWGGLKHPSQEFNSQVGHMNGSLLLLAIVAMIIPTAAHHAPGGTLAGVTIISHYTAIILLIIYALSLLFQLKTNVGEFESESAHHGHEAPAMTIRDAWVLLIIATGLVSWMAHTLVGSIEAAVEEYHLPELFIGVILVPFFGNAAEHFTAIIVAGKNKMDLSISIAIGSSVQIALFVAPAMILFAWFLGVPLTLEFGLLETTATFMAVLVVNTTLGDNKTNWLEGAMLIACYLILALAFLQY
jgi:Ca2+:H+ antiporter